MTPRPEANLPICHGLLAARAHWRAQVVTYGRVEGAPTASTAPPIWVNISTPFPQNLWKISWMTFSGSFLKAWISPYRPPFIRHGSQNDSMRLEVFQECKKRFPLREFNQMFPTSDV